MKCFALFAVLLLAVAQTSAGADVGAVEADLVVYGSSPAAIATAVQARRMGRSCVVVSPETRIGGLTTGGLGQTDIGSKSAFGGIALEFYRDVAAYYRDPANWKWQKRGDYFPDGQCAGTRGDDTMWTFEPSAALKILEGWERRDGLDVRRGERLDRGKGGVVTKDGRIVSFRTLAGRVYRGKMFVDATYEGDLLAAAGVSYVVGREANDVYGETVGGIERRLATNHQMNPGVSAYVKAGDPSSGLLPGVEPDVADPDGAGDRRVQAYCFRLCLTDVPENRIPFAKPANYDERNYELLLRNLEAIPPETFAKNAKTPWNYMPWINSAMPNRKTDTNNRTGVSTDFVGGSRAWPEASYDVREKILKAHLDYQAGLMWTLANHPRVPAPIRAEVARWGTCRDEFADGLGDGWQSQLYVREARRLVGECVVTEADVLRERRTTRPVAMAAYGMDSHNVRRYVDANGCARNEGNIEDWRSGGRPYPLDYGCLLPKRGECANLLVPVCVSASHVAFGSIRMEPVFFALGQVAGTAASLAIEDGCAVQDVPYAKLRARLLADGQVLGEDGVAGLTVGEIAALTREEASAASPCVVTGVVTGAFNWLKKSCVIADASDPNGPAIYAADMMPGFANTVFAGGGSPSVGDLLEVRGVTIRLMLQPGVYAREMRRIGRVALPEFPLRRLADLATGRFDNRRARLRGVVRRVRVDDAVPVTLMELGTSDGVVIARLREPCAELAGLRNAEVEVSGVAMPCFNSRAEQVRPELELESRDSLHVLAGAPREIPEIDGARGVLSWQPAGNDGHLRRLRGVVTATCAADGYFVVQNGDGGRAVRVFPDGEPYPSVGACVEVVGFPTLVGACGAMDAAESRVATNACAILKPEPLAVSVPQLEHLLAHGEPGEFDCCDRFVQVEGRVRSFERSSQGGRLLILSVGERPSTLAASLDGELPADVEKTFVDGPLVRLTGVLDIDLERSPVTKRGLVVGRMVLRLRDADDVVVLPDAAFRGRRALRQVRGALSWLAIPLVLVVVVLLLRIYRQRSVAQAVAAERHRMAGELHDSLSQHLSSARLLLFSVQQGAGVMTDAAKRSLAMMGNVLESARREVRDVVMHLQSESFMSASPTALLKTMAEGLRRTRSVRVCVNLRGLPAEMPVVEKTDLVAIVQEAITNAIKHGGAETVILVSDPLPGGGFALSVLNDGEPFDAEKALGPEAGHFGLSGMRERASRSRLALSFGSRDGFSEVRVERKGG